MALRNYLFTGSYTIIESFSYGKGTAITAVLKVYTDETKTKEVCTRSVNIYPNQVPRLDGAFLTEPPSQVEVGAGFLTAPSGCTGVWTGREYTYAVWNGYDWVFWMLGGRTLYYDVQNEVYLRLTSSYSLVPVECFEDQRVWDRWFNFSDPTLNIVRNLYLCIKEGNSFKNCIDG